MENQDLGQLNKKVYTIESKENSLVFVKGSPYIEFMKPHFKLKDKTSPSIIHFEEYSFDKKKRCFEGEINYPCADANNIV